jgi:hypothetical protein
MMINLRFIIAITILMLTVVVSSCGCGDLNDNKTSAPTQKQTHSWASTDDGKIEYRWETNGAGILRDSSGQMYISRQQPTGKIGQIVWEWTEDGKLILDIYKNHYVLDSPYTYGSNSYRYGTGAGGLLLGGRHPIFLKKGYVVVHSWDKKGRPLDSRGRVIPTVDKYGKPLRLIDLDGNDVKIEP